MSGTADSRDLKGRGYGGPVPQPTTRTAILHFRHEDLRRQMQQEYEAAARAEFPSGTRVRWPHTHFRGQVRYAEGVVHELGSSQAQVRSRSGALHNVDFWRLEFAHG